MVQFEVPVAMPDGPVELLHETSTTPVSSWAVPFTTTVDRCVDTLVVEGLVIVREGAVTS